MKKCLEFAKLFGLKYPVIIQAPMAGGVTTPELVAAVSNACGLGSFATGYLSTEQVKDGIASIKKLTTNPFAINLFAPSPCAVDSNKVLKYQQFLNRFRKELGMGEIEDAKASIPGENFDELVNLLIDEDIKVVSFTFGDLPDYVVKSFKAKGVYLIGTATTLEEAKILDAAGIDAIVVQSYEAGGHRGGFFSNPSSSLIGAMSLIPRVADAIKRPVIASGGIMDGRGIVAAISLGASAVQMGTAFLTTKESGASSVYKDHLIRQAMTLVDQTSLTSAYSGKMARGINNEFMKAAHNDAISLPQYPIPHYLSSPLRKEATKLGSTNIMSMWAGQSVGLIRNNLTAEKLLDDLRREVSDCLNDLSNSPCI